MKVINGAAVWLFQGANDLSRLEGNFTSRFDGCRATTLLYYLA